MWHCQEINVHLPISELIKFNDSPLFYNFKEKVI